MLRYLFNRVISAIAPYNSKMKGWNTMPLYIMPICDRCFFGYAVQCDRALQLQDEGMEYDASLYYAYLRSLFF
ncbi:MAG: hypothetical protein AB4368_04540 [Xenococcaceae cyanobacterium]